MPENFNNYENNKINNDDNIKYLFLENTDKEIKYKSEKQNIIDKSKSDLEFEKRGNEIEKKLKNLIKLNELTFGAFNNKVLKKAISFLDKEKQEEIKNLKSFEEFAIFYGKETGIIFYTWNNGKIYLARNLYDKKREVKEINTDDYLPEDNIYIKELKKFQINKEKIKLLPIKGWGAITNEYTIYIGESKDKDDENFILANESLHILFEKIGSHNLNYSKEVLGRKYNLQEIEEFLSDYSSMKKSKKYMKDRIIDQGFSGSNYRKTVMAAYDLIFNFYDNILEEVLGKEFKNSVSHNYDDKAKIEKLLKEIENKTITYNGQTFSGFDYIFYRIEEQANIFLKDIYELKMKEKVK